MLKAKRDLDAPDLPVRLDGLTDEPPQRSIARLMTWAGVALLAVSAALLAARSETGAQRIARLTAPVAPVQQAQRAEPPRPATDPLLLYETRRLADQVRLLAAEREALAERVASMERSVGDVTASIPRTEVTGPATRQAVRVIPTSPPPSAAATPPAPPSLPASPAPAATVIPDTPAATSAPASAPVPTPSPAAVAAAPPEAQESTTIRTDFGVDLAGDQSIDALRSRWQQLRAQHGPVLEGLRPVISIQEGGRPGSVELRLVVGPLSNANAAARLCATLSLAGVNCKTAVFDGQRLALR
ncbi:hypothetical protein ACJ4V0_15295 [Phreatobacter sp. HK31-P]